MNCKKCGKEFDPSMEFVEDYELLEALNWFVETEHLCPKCCYKLRDVIERNAKDFING
jgi:hypothetical protein